MWEAYSHEVSSCGYWPGPDGEGRLLLLRLSRSRPGSATRPYRRRGARWDDDLGEFVLPYDAVRERREPDALLLEFLQSTYEAAADLAGWDRDALERR